MATPIATTSFLGIVGFIAIAFVWAVTRAIEPEQRAGAPFRWACIAAVWLTVTALPTLLGLVAPAGPLPAQAILFALFVVVVAFAYSPLGRKVALAVPVWALVGFQGFRLPLELVLHRWAEAGVAPPQMTWTGQNPDIVSGVIALAAVPFVQRSRSLAWVPTVVGLVLLGNIGRVVATSLPGPLQRFPDELTLPQQFPHIWIGTVCVTGALLGHLLVIRALREQA